MADLTEVWALRLYNRLPEVYRTRDFELGQPLLGALKAIASQVSAVRQDMDDLWDNFFIETCDDWVVPYIGALVGTRLLANPVGQSNRLDVRNTILWRRSKGTPTMLADLAAATTGPWQARFAEFFKVLAWNQNLNHPPPDRPVVIAIRDVALVTQVGRAGDRAAHTADIRPAHDLDAARLVRDPLAGAGPPALGEGSDAWGTPGRYGIKQVGFYMRRLQTFRNQGVTPFSDGGRGYTFDPLGRDAPLFSEASGSPIGRGEFFAAPAAFFGPGSDLAVRRHGVAFALPPSPPLTFSQSGDAFTFGDTSPVALNGAEGLRLLQPSDFPIGCEHFVITALWRVPGGDVELGSLRTLEARLGDQAGAFALGAGTPLAGRLVLRIQTGSGAGPGRFPETVLAVRNDRPRPRVARDVANPTLSAYQDALLVYLPERFLRPGEVVELHVANDGSSYWSSPLEPGVLAASSAGQVWPPADLRRPSPVPVEPVLHRRLGLQPVDTDHFADGILLAAYVMKGVPQLAGALLTQSRPLGSVELDSQLANPGGDPGRLAFHYYPSQDAVTGRLPDGQLLLRMSPLPGAPSISLVPQCEIVVRDRGGHSLLVYLPEIELDPEHAPAWLYVADDGSVYSADLSGHNPLPLGELALLADNRLARVGAGQVLPLEGAFPLRRRTVGGGRADAESIWIDPERGRFCLAEGDPLLKVGPDARDLTVDYVEAFADRVGARAFDREVDPVSTPTRAVASSGDTDRIARFEDVHTTLADALAHAAPGERIEIVDSATYRENVSLNLAGATQITVRAASHPRFERPCLLLHGAEAAFRVTTSGGGWQLELEGILLGGGRLVVQGDPGSLSLLACTLDPAAGGPAGSIVVTDDDPDHQGRLLLCRSITGALRLGRGLERLTVADSVVQRSGGGLAVGGLAEGPDPAQDRATREVQLERATILGRVCCESLEASESLLRDLAQVEDRQLGCIRFSRFQLGSTLPRRYRCVPSDPDAAAGEAAHPVFRSLNPASPGYAQLGVATSTLVLNASQSADQVGVFARSYEGIRLRNLHSKLLEFLPAGLEPVVIAET